MTNIFKIISALLLLLFLGACTNKSTQTNDKVEKISKPQETRINIVSLQQRQLDVMKIKLGKIKYVNLGNTLKVNGQLELPPQRKASVSAIVGGRVKSVAVIEGDYVTKGQVLAKLNNPEFISMQRDYLSAKSNITFLEKNYMRKKTLFKDGIASAKSFQEAEAVFNQAKLELNATKANLKLIGLDIALIEKGKIVSTVPIVSPISGNVQKIDINIGKFVSPEQEMFDIVDNAHLHIGLKVFEKDIDKVKVGQKVTFALTTKSEKIYEGEIFALGSAFEMATRAVKVHAKIIGTHKGLLSGMFVEARIVASNKKVNALPDGAFVTEKGLDYIFIQRKRVKNKIEFEKIQVNKGVSDLGFTEVVFINRMPKNAIVVTKGVYYVNAEMQKSEFADED
ncbi:MAG: efflux RND transporter periplasmic adaptor subunit [Flavobacteriaceae bacterium]|nr:efflux RND transporter periplasmic adaptor subunit [Flavobacteriaceae bacterium]